MMKRYGLSLEDRQLHQYLLRDLITLNQKHEPVKQKNILSYVGVGKRDFNMVPIPRAASLGQIQRKEKYSKWISKLLYALCGGHHHNDPTRPLLGFVSYFALSETNQDIWKEAVDLNRGLTIPKINKVITKAIQSMFNINGNHMRILQRYLRIELGSSIFATQHKISQIVDLEYVELVTGIFKFGSEHIPWSYKAIEKCLMLWMETRQKRDNYNNYNKAYKQIDICINIDHGKGHSRILANFILRYQYDRWWCMV